MEIIVRYAEISDAETIASFIEKLAVYENLQDSCKVSAKKIERHLLGRDPTLYILLAEADGVPIGFAVFYVGGYSTFKNTWQVYLEDIFVEKEFRGKGVGKLLLQQIGRRALERGIFEVAFCVLSWNEDSINAYKKLGAIETGQKITGQDVWVTMSFFEKSLTRLVGE